MVIFISYMYLFHTLYHGYSPPMHASISDIHVTSVSICTGWTYTYMNKSGGPEQARQTADSCFELVGSHQHRVCTSYSGHTGFMYPKVSLLIVVSGIHPPQTAELHPREKPNAAV